MHRICQYSLDTEPLDHSTLCIYACNVWSPYLTTARSYFLWYFFSFCRRALEKKYTYQVKKLLQFACLWTVKNPSKPRGLFCHILCKYERSLKKDREYVFNYGLFGALFAFPTLRIA